MHRGYVPVWRKLKDSTFYRDSEAVHLWLHILFEAQHSEKKEWFKGKEVVLQEGQFTTGRKRLASETGISESKIQRLLKKFEKCHMIEQQTNSANRLISITNYKSHKASEQQVNSKRTASEQQVNNVRTHSNNVKNENIEELKETTCFSFENFWNDYEKKGNRKTTEQRYSKIKEKDRELIKSKLSVYIKSTPDKQYRKNAEVWLNQECWNDEVVDKSVSSMQSTPLYNSQYDPDNEMDNPEGKEWEIEVAPEYQDILGDMAT
jgi:DNA-binding MarR family transcriptional regulator